MQASPGVSPQQRYTAHTNSGRLRTCNRCNKPFFPQALPAGHPRRGNQYVTTAEKAGLLYHPECLNCAACGKPISAVHVRHKGRLYHDKCHKQRFGITCNCCHQKIEAEVTPLCYLTLFCCTPRVHMSPA